MGTRLLPLFVLLLQCSPTRTVPSGGVPVAVSPPKDPPIATAPAPAGAHPRVRVDHWLCEDQECEGGPTYAYDDLPAVHEDGSVVAVVEERDGWGHTKSPGIRLLSSSSATLAFYPVVSKNAKTHDEADIAASRAKHEPLLAAVNAELSKATWRPLLPPNFVAWEVRVNGQWTAAESLAENAARPEERAVSEVAGVRLTFYARPNSSGFSGPNRVDLDVLDHIDLQTENKVVASINTRSWTDHRCSQTVVRALGVRPELRIALLAQMSGRTSHACDGKEEKDSYHVVRW